VSQIFPIHNLKNQNERPRVFREGYKGGFPWYKALSLLKPPVGTNPPPELLKIKEIEDIFSECYQKMEKANKLEYIPGKKDIPKLPENCPYYFFDQKNIQFFLDKSNDFGTLFYHIDTERKGVKQIEKFLQQSEYSNFGDFIDAKNRNRALLDLKRDAIFNIKNEAIIDLLDTFDLDPEKLYEQDCKVDPEKCSAFGVPWNELSTTVKYSVLQTYLKRISIHKNEFKISRWKPQDNVSVLIKELQEYGPLCVGANLGPQTYESPPLKLERAVDRDIYYWKKGSTRTSQIANAVLIVGARASGYVYIVDPQDSSNPSNVEEQRIYVISYKNLITNVLDLESVYRKKAPNGIGYAIYANSQESDA